MTSARVAEVAQRTLNYKEQVGIANEVGGGRATGILYKVAQRSVQYVAVLMHKTGYYSLACQKKPSRR